VICLNTIEFDTISTLEIKKSKFITVLKKVETEEDIKKELENIKKEYPNAKHYTYAYILDHIKKMSDDKEPSGTAGAPILTVLERHHLNHVLCIVVRYFGGILLGAPGLVRAYSKSVSNCLSQTNIIPFIVYLKVTITFSYDASKKIDYLLKDYPILKKEFSDTIMYSFLLKEEDKYILKEIEKNVIFIDIQKAKN
jgi:uncharacterized YigZ family protein